MDRAMTERLRGHLGSKFKNFEPANAAEHCLHVDEIVSYPQPLLRPLATIGGHSETQLDVSFLE
jgi:hypothetical protein